MTIEGFTYEGSCNCDGFQTEKYRRGDLQIKVRTARQLFKIKQNGHSKTMWIPVEHLKQTLAKYVAIQA